MIKVYGWHIFLLRLYVKLQFLFKRRIIFWGVSCLLHRGLADTRLAVKYTIVSYDHSWHIPFRLLTSEESEWLEIMEWFPHPHLEASERVGTTHKIVIVLISGAKGNSVVVHVHSELDKSSKCLTAWKLGIVGDNNDILSMIWPRSPKHTSPSYIFKLHILRAIHI